MDKVSNFLNSDGIYIEVVDAVGEKIKVGPRGVEVEMVPALSEALKDHLSIWEPFAIDGLVILQDKAPEKVGKVFLSNGAQKKEQLNIGTGWVIGKCRDANHINPRLDDINIGDRVKYPSLTTISAECGQNIPERLRVQVLHLNNLMQITRCGPDNPSDILGYESTEGTSPQGNDETLPKTS